MSEEVEWLNNQALEVHPLSQILNGYKPQRWKNWVTEKEALEWSSKQAWKPSFTVC